MPRKRRSAPRDPELATLGEAIEVLMKRGGLNQTDVANASDLGNRQVGNYARGQTGPTYRNLRRLCRGLGVTPATMMLTIEQIETDEIEAEPRSAGSALADVAGTAC